jgi:hypothetical protein
LILSENNRNLLKIKYMDGISSVVYKEVDPSKKDAVWANQIISVYRRSWRQLANVQRCLENRQYLYSMQSLDYVKDSFQDEDFKKHVDFIPLPIMESLINTMVEEITKTPPKAELKATDPAAINQKKEDLLLLRNRKILENDITKYNNQVGIEGKYKLGYDKFHGNVEAFDKMGLNEKDPQDLNFYEDNYQRLDFETAAQLLINNIIKVNTFDETTIRKIVKDVFALKTICTQAYVDNMTGQIKWKYIDPQVCYGIFGQTNDGKDDVCRGYQDSVSVWEWLQMVGNEFDFQRDWTYLLWAINYCNTATRWTGFLRSGVAFDCCGNAQLMGQMGMSDVEVPNLLDWSSAYTFKISMGYIEWRTIDATATYLRSHKNPNYVEPVGYGFQLKKKKEQKEYYKESYYQQQWYRSYFLATTSISQWIFGFQKVYYQTLEGANDEFANGTLCYYQEEGKSAVEIAKPYLQEANFEFYRRLWLIYKAKPDVDEFQYEELIELAKGFQRQFPQSAGANTLPQIDTILNQVIQYQKKNHVRIRMYPRVDGKVIPQVLPIEKNGTGGIDATATMMQVAIMWAEQQIAAKIGMNPMRFGMNPPPRESFKTENTVLQSSFVTTGYMYRMIQYMKQHLATTSLTYAQDIIQFKDSIPYKWIRTVLGDESFEALKVLGKVCAHRFGIFIGDYNTAMEKQRIIQAADIALAQGNLTQSQWFIISQTDDPKRANAILARMEIQKEKKEKAFEMQKMQMQDQMNQNAHDREMQRLSFSRETEWGKADRQAAAQQYTADASANSRIAVKKLQNEGEVPKQDAKAQGQQDILRTKQNLEEQTTFQEAVS